MLSLRAASSPLSGMGVTVARVCATARTLARFCIHHADVDVRVWRAPCVCSDHLLPLISSTDAAETQLDAAVRDYRAYSAARCVVGASQATTFASSDLVCVLLAVIGGGPERVGAMCEARVGLSVRISGYLCVCWTDVVPGPHVGPIGVALERTGGCYYTQYAKTRYLVSCRAATCLERVETSDERRLESSQSRV